MTNFFTPVNTFFIAIVILVAVIVCTRKVLAAIADFHSAMTANQTEIGEQVKLAKFNAIKAAIISQKTDDQIAADAVKIDAVSDKIDAQNIQTIVVADQLARTVTETAGDLAGTVTATASQLADDLTARVESVHKLVNGPMTARVRQVAELSRRIAGLTRRPEDAEVADAAERDLAEKVAKDITAGESL